MRMTAGRLAARLALVLAVAVSLLAPATAASAEDECATDIGTDLPVVLVHGFNSAMSTWDGGLTSIDQTLAREAGIHVQWFDYSDVATQWVTHDRIGPRLAAFLTCTARVSREAGGPGKVVVVAHSMGGLATRCALAESCGKAAGVDQLVDLVITLGTPHEGSFWRTSGVNAALVGANAGTQALISGCRSPLGTQPPFAPLCSAIAIAGGASTAAGLDKKVGPLIDSPAARAFTPGSRELRSLPGFPRRTAVHAMAGEMTLVTHLFNVVVLPISTENWPIGDGVVGRPSASARHQDGEAARGGTTVKSCGYVDFSIYAAVLPTCNHVTFTQDSTFTGEVISAVREYRDGLPRVQHGSFALGLGGAIGDLGYWAPEAEALALVNRALGPPDSDTGWIAPECGPVAGATWRLVRWGAFELLLTDTPLPNPDGTEQPGGPVKHVAGWTYTPEELGLVFPQLELENGLTLGSRFTDVLDAYPDAEQTVGPFAGLALSVFEGDFGNLFVDFDATARVVALTSGQGGCGDP
jgi:pimeloyl-ACP methyl ester carboxylesterase